LRLRKSEAGQGPRKVAALPGGWAEVNVANAWSHQQGASSDAIRVGVMLDSYSVPRWIRLILEQIVEARFAELALVILNADAPPVAKRSLKERLRTLGAHAFWRYERFDYRRTRSPLDAFEPTDTAELLQDIETMHVQPISPKPYEHRFNESDIDEIRGHGIDVILRFGFRIIRGDILNCARYGAWSFHHGDNAKYRGGPSLFWEIYEGTTVSGSLLQILTDDLDAGVVIYRSWSATDLRSLHRNRNAVYWKTAHFVIRCLRELHAYGFEHLLAQRSHAEARDLGPVHRAPSLPQMIRFAARIAARSIPSKMRLAAFREQWCVAVRDLDSEVAGRFIFVRPPSDRYYADPCIVERDGRHFVFIEDYSYSEARGMISYFEIFEDGSVSSPMRVLEPEYHVSYPFVFEHDGEMYMIPESSANRTIELYRATRFPVEWRLERLLIEDIYALDPTLLVRPNKLWLFASVPEEGARAGDELSLFRSDSLDSDWIPHPLNPIVSDVRRARPAGRIFVRDDELIRPGQDSSRTYGYAVVLNRIELLTATEYHERPIDRIEPTWTRGNLGTHTYSFDARYEVLDGRWWQLNFRRRP
jgi:hypothetical protein